MAARIQKIPVQPYFDLEEFMNLARESRLESSTITSLLNRWEEWQDKLAAVGVENGGNSWLAAWLPEEVEIIVDEAWKDTPSKGYLLNVLAQYLCMATVQDIIPQIADHGCAPAPVPQEALACALEEAGLEYNMDTGAPARRYSVLTHYPFKGGCEVCNMRSACPKGSGKDSFSSILLPGYERGQD